MAGSMANWSDNQPKFLLLGNCTLTPTVGSISMSELLAHGMYTNCSVLQPLPALEPDCCELENSCR